MSIAHEHQEQTATTKPKSSHKCLCHHELFPEVVGRLGHSWSKKEDRQSVGSDCLNASLWQSPRQPWRKRERAWVWRTPGTIYIERNTWSIVFPLSLVATTGRLFKTLHIGAVLSIFNLVLLVLSSLYFAKAISEFLLLPYFQAYQVRQSVLGHHHFPKENSQIFSQIHKPPSLWEQRPSVFEGSAFCTKAMPSKFP